MGKVPLAKGAVSKPTEFKGVANEKEYETRIIVLAQGIEGHDEDVKRQAAKQAEFARKCDEAKELALAENKKKLAAKYGKKANQIRLCYLPYWKPELDYLKEKFGDELKIEKNSDNIKNILSEYKLEKFRSVRRVGLYTSKNQKVKFVIVTIVSKKDFKTALETGEPPLHVIYAGHSRFGRGACFDTYAGVVEQEGNQWEDGVKGREEDSGLFRLGHPYVPVSLKDLAHHYYDFTPCPVEDGPPPNEKNHPFSRHRNARNCKLKKMDIRNVQFVERDEKGKKTKTPPINLELNTRSLSRIGEYYGLIVEGERNLLLRAGWEPSKKFDIMDPCLFAPNLGETDLNCRVFCHFGCSSRVHYWDIVRRKEYKGWQKPKPPTDRYAYFTRYPADARLGPLWLYFLLSYDKENKNKPWVDSLEETKKQTNQKLNEIGEPKNMIY